METQESRELDRIIEKEKQDKLSWQEFAYYLKTSLNIVKKELGSKCKFLSFSKEKYFDKTTNTWEDVNTFYARMVNKTGGIDKVLYALPNNIWDLQPEHFNMLVDNLKNGEYERQGANN